MTWCAVILEALDERSLVTGLAVLAGYVFFAVATVALLLQGEWRSALALPLCWAIGTAITCGIRQLFVWCARRRA